MTRESTKARCYNFLAMNCDVKLKAQAKWKGDFDDNKRIIYESLIRIELLCEILKIDKSNLNYYKTVKKYRPDLFEQDFYNDVRKWVE